MVSRKSLLAIAGAAALLAGCATDPYYDRYAYNDGTYVERPVVRYYDEPGYYPYYYPRYYGPAVGLSFSFSNHGYWRHH